MNWDVRKASVRAAETLAVMALYFVAGKVGLLVPFTNGNISPVWPATGIALGAIVMLGPHVCLGIAAGAFLVNFFSPIPHTAALAITVGNTLGPALAAVWLRRQSVIPIRHLADVLRLILFGGAGLAITAVIASSALFMSGVHVANSLPLAMAVWWVGDLMGVLLVFPLIVNFAELKARKERLPELLLLMVCLLAASELLFRQSTVIGAVFGFALLPFIIWGAVRFSIAGAALTSCLTSIFAVCETARGDGPFAVYGTWAHHVEALQVFMGVLSISGLCLAAVIAERDTVEAALAREGKLRHAQDQYRRIIETTNDGVWMIDTEYRATFVNRRMAEMLGYTPEEMLGHQPFDFLFPEDVPQKRADLERRRAGTREVLYSRFRRKDGSELWAVLSTAPVLSAAGKFNGALAMLSDVTLLRKSEEALRRNDKLVTAGRLAAAISHEVNNPLEAVVNLMYLLKDEPMSAQARQFVALAEKEILRVSAISKRTLGFFRDTSAWTELSLPALVDETLSLYERELASRGIQIKRDYHTRGLVRASQGELLQVFANIISNAVDAMANGGMLTVRIFDVTSPGPQGIRVEVEDTGAGIREDDVNRIFEPFFTTKRNTGTGLGLWVVKEIIGKHGGTIAVASHTQPGEKRGTQFSIFLPSTAAAIHAVA